MQAPLAIVNQHQEALTAALTARLAPAPVAVYPQFSLNLPPAAALCWLAPLTAPVDELVMGLVRLVDAGQAPARIVMLAAAGICDDVEPAGLHQLYGDDYSSLLFAHQYAVKMVDELEIPYTVLRVPHIGGPQRPVAVTAENQPLASLTVSQASVVHALQTALATEKYVNQSVGISNEVKDNGTI